ncbi:YolD-like protein [Brevibacillus sp. AG162]|uniref:YolD-like family protein n=1 Tax=Brevibacillus sp. AG162 TaxID=2572910 RepID=UPI00115019A4|nr:YolD-like family protein [Brevibacillus sp. AG162]TQK41988.1 YolD-like protein [Brevibacillus sp. AG162]
MAKKIDNLFGSSRFVLPEQRELYLQMKEDDKLVPMPILEQDELATFDYLLRDAQQKEKAVSITWWRHKKDELGTICTMWGAVPEINANTRKVKLLTVEDVQWINMERIIDVST